MNDRGESRTQENAHKERCRACPSGHMGPQHDPDDLDLLIAESGPEVLGAMDDAAARRRLKVALTHHREIAGLTQTDVALAMDTTQSAVSDFEGGATDPYLSTFQRYARAVGCRIKVEIVPTLRLGSTGECSRLVCVHGERCDKGGTCVERLFEQADLGPRAGRGTE